MVWIRGLEVDFHLPSKEPGLKSPNRQFNLKIDMEPGNRLKFLAQLNSKQAFHIISCFPNVSHQENRSARKFHSDPRNFPEATRILGTCTAKDWRGFPGTKLANFELPSSEPLIFVSLKFTWSHWMLLPKDIKFLLVEREIKGIHTVTQQYLQPSLAMKTEQGTLGFPLKKSTPQQNPPENNKQTHYFWVASNGSPSPNRNMKKPRWYARRLESTLLFNPSSCLTPSQLVGLSTQTLSLAKMLCLLLRLSFLKSGLRKPKGKPKPQIAGPP